MSQKSAEDFIAKVSSDESLQTKIASLTKGPAAFDRLVQLGAASGFAFTKPDLLAAIKTRVIDVRRPLGDAAPGVVHTEWSMDVHWEG